MDATTITALLWGLAAPGPAAAPAERIAFTPEPGTAIRYAWTAEHDLRSESITMAIGAQRATAPVEIDIDTRARLDCVDEVRAVEDGRPVEFRRRYETATRRGEMSFPENPKEPSRLIERNARIEDASVVFTWVADEDGYGRYFDAREGHESDLPLLAADVGLLGFLPEGEVEPGASWDVPAAALQDAFGFGGRMQFRDPGDVDEMFLRTLKAGVGDELVEVFEKEPEGGARVTFEGIREEAGTRLAVLHFETDLELSLDKTEFARKNQMRRERIDRVEHLGAELDVRLVGEGELLWDLDAGHARSFDYRGDETISIGLRFRLPSDPDEFEREQVMALRGALHLELGTEKAEVIPAPGPK